MPLPDPSSFTFGGKPLSRKLHVWWMLRRNYELVLIFLGLLVLLGLSEVTLDGVFGTLPEASHVHKTLYLPKTFQERQNWIAQCVEKTPRLARPQKGGTHRLHTLNRHLFCLAASPMLLEPATLVDVCEGGAGTGFALWMGARLGSKRREVIITHKSNREMLNNFPKTDSKIVRLTHDLSEYDTLDKACAKPDTQVVAINGGEPLVHYSNAYTAFSECAHLKYLAITGVYPDEIERVASMGGKVKWAVMASGVDYKSSSPATHIFCILRIGILCQRVPWVLLARI